MGLWRLGRLVILRDVEDGGGEGEGEGVVLFEGWGGIGTRDENWKWEWEWEWDSYDGGRRMNLGILGEKRRTGRRTGAMYFQIKLTYALRRAEREKEGKKERGFT